jgi:hypothetical protein
VDKVMARKPLKTRVVAARYCALHRFRAWLWLLSILLAIACLVSTEAKALLISARS